MNHRPRANTAGALAEEVVWAAFGAKEPEYEVKACGTRNNAVVLCAYQLLNSLEKQYVIVFYRRPVRKIRRGPRKGLKTMDVPLTRAFTESQLEIFVVRGIFLAQHVLDKKLFLYCNQKGRDVRATGKWGLYWRIPKGVFEAELFERMAETERYVLYGDPLDPPAWTLDTGRQRAGYLPFGSGVETFGDERTAP